MTDSMYSTSSSEDLSAATGSLTREMQLWAASIRQQGIVDVTYSGRSTVNGLRGNPKDRHPRSSQVRRPDDALLATLRPWPGAVGSPSEIFNVPSELYDAVQTSIGEDPGKAPLEDAMAGFTSLPSSCVSRFPPLSRQLLVLSVFRYTVANIRHMRRNYCEESLWQSNVESMFNVLLSSSQWLHAAHTDTHLHRDVADPFGDFVEVKPDITIGMLKGRIDFRQGDESIPSGEEIEMYAASRGVLYNLNQLSSSPWFPHLICEVKSLQCSPAEVERQIVNGMYYALNIHLELATLAEQADPVTYARNPIDHVLSSVYGLTFVGEYWTLWMLAGRADGAEPKYPMLQLGHGLGRDVGDMKRLFVLLERIEAEAQKRVEAIGLWLYCLRNTSPKLKRAGAQVEVAGDEHGEVTPKQTRRARQSSSARHAEAGAGGTAEERKQVGARKTRQRPLLKEAESMLEADRMRSRPDEAGNSQMFELTRVPARDCRKPRVRIKSSGLGRSAASVSRSKAKVLDWLSGVSASASSDDSGSGESAV